MKPALILYLVIFAFYIVFARQPDYFDGQFATGAIHFVRDSAAKAILPKAFFTAGKKEYVADAAYLFRNFKEGERVKLIYDTSKPGNAAVYSLWGYWIRWGEILFSLAAFAVMYFIAVSITSHPSPESLIDLA